MDYNDIRFLHDADLGITIGYKLINSSEELISPTTIIGSISFAHKSSPSNKGKVDTFQKKVGREVVSGRINNMLKENKVYPSAFIFKKQIKGKPNVFFRKVEEAIYNSIDSLKSRHNIDHTNNYRIMKYDEQIQNKYIQRVIVETIQDVTSNTNS